MSTRKLIISELKGEVRDKLKDFIDKKLGGVQRQLADAIGANDADVSHWLQTGGAPAWAMLKIFETYDDAAEFFLRGKDPKPVDPRRDALRQRIEQILENDFMLDHLTVQIGICEDALERDDERRVMAEALQLLRKDRLTRAERARVAELAQRKYGKHTTEGHTVHDPAPPYPKAAPEQTSETPPRTPDADPPGEIKTDSESEKPKEG